MKLGPARRSRPRLACLGDLTLDVVVRAEAAIEAGTDVPGAVRFRSGGSAANSARAFAGLGGMASFIGAVGDDDLGARLIAGLRSSGVNVHAVRVHGRSARLAAMLGLHGERSFITERGVADSLAPEMLKTSWLARVDALHLPAYSLLRAPLAEAAFAAVGLVRQRGAIVSVDLASRVPLMANGRRAARALIRRAGPDVLFGNAEEAEALVGSLDPVRLVKLAPVVVVKLGAAGCQVLRSGPEPDEVHRSLVAAKAIATTDTTGAGDAFDAGFLHSLIGSDYRPPGFVSDAALRRAALSGHAAAARLLTLRREELFL